MPISQNNSLLKVIICLCFFDLPNRRAFDAHSYSLPRFPDEVQKKLAIGGDQFKIGSKARVLLIDAIHDDVVSGGIL